MKAIKWIAVLLLGPVVASAQLRVTVSSVKITGQKAVVPFAMKNTFTEKIESARATAFLVDDQGKVVGQATRWVIGGTKDRPALDAGKETTFHFVIPTNKPFKQSRVTFTRLILAGGKSVDPGRNVQVQQGSE